MNSACDEYARKMIRADTAGTASFVSRKSDIAARGREQMQREGKSKVEQTRFEKAWCRPGRHRHNYADFLESEIWQ